MNNNDSNRSRSGRPPSGSSRGGSGASAAEILTRAARARVSKALRADLLEDPEADLSADRTDHDAPERVLSRIGQTSDAPRGDLIADRTGPSDSKRQVFRGSDRGQGSREAVFPRIGQRTE